MTEDKRHIISGLSRGRIAAALVEYRAHTRDGDPLDLEPVIRDIRTALRQRRVVDRLVRGGR